MLQGPLHNRSDHALINSAKRYRKYELKDDEVKILRTRYDPISSEFLGIEYCVALFTVKDDPEEQFFDYGYNKDNSKMLYSTKK